MDDNKISVLLIDDNIIDAKVIQKMLSVAGDGVFAVEWASDLAAGLGRLHRQEFDILLLDLWLPDSQGLETFIRAHGEFPDLPIVVLSGAEDEATAVNAIQGGAQDYLVKTWVNKHLLARSIRLAVERKRTEKALARERYLLRTLIDNLPDYVFVKDAASRFLLNNAAHAASLGVKSQEDLVGKTNFDFLPKEAAEQSYAEEQAIIQTGEALINQERFRYDKSGKRLWFSTTKVPWQDQHGQTVGLVGISRDITARREAEEELKISLQMKNDFVSFATHQLRTPLAGIRWLLELASQGESVPEETASLIKDALEAAQRLITLVNDLLDVSRIESGKLVLAPQTTDLGQVTQSVLKDVNHHIQQQGHELTIEGTGNIPSVFVDPQLFRQVILNLISNAVKYTPAHGKIRIKMNQENGSVRWAIQDTGIGIPKASQARLFQKFYRAENVYKIETEGTGLGLYLVRLIVERSGGKIWCESDEGQGSTFLFTVPVEATNVR